MEFPSFLSGHPESTYNLNKTVFLSSKLSFKLNPYLSQGAASLSCMEILAVCEHDSLMLQILFAGVGKIKGLC